jgi:malate dehydrogenase (oxaloacetate-decarboxylating)(NADP+)
VRPRTPDKRGLDLLQDPRLNKGTAFTAEERAALGLEGLLPPRVFTIEEQLGRVMGNFRAKPSDLERYVYMVALQDRNETLFYRTVVDHLPEMLPIIYTPTVGEACARFGQMFRRPRGLYVSARDRGRVAELLRNWPEREIAVVVVTDGERILGLGDLGTYGMGIPIGKLALYTACGGIRPSHCLPVMLDVGTDNAALLADPLYTGLRQRRIRGDPYADLVDEFVTELETAFPGVLIQFEDFATANALGLLARYRDRVCAFNDDVQGTAAVTLGALLVSGRMTGRRLAEERLLFAGAGAAATGIADLAVEALRRDGLTRSDAERRVWMFDVQGLLVRERSDLPATRRRYAHEHPPVADLPQAIRALRPTALIGVTGQGQLFSEQVLRAMAGVSDRPVVFALSNPTSRAECTAEQAYEATGGRAVFSSGSPYTPVELDGRRFAPSQTNNAYVFPGVGLAVTTTGARRVTDQMLLAAAESLAGLADEATLRTGALLPPLERIREVSLRVALAVAREVIDAGLARRETPVELEPYLRARMYRPDYRPYV